jgi:hypothetical protein
MATYKIIAQTSPPAMTLAVMLKATAQTDIVSFVICNHSEVYAKFRISVKAAAGPDYFVQYDTPIGANATIPLTYQITLGVGDIIHVYSTTSTVDFSAFGFTQ